MNDPFSSDVKRDLPAVKRIELENNTIYIKKTDPYGFWTVNFDKGQMPENLRGSYTSFSDAEREVLTYLRNKKRLKEIRDTRD